MAGMLEEANTLVINATEAEITLNEWWIGKTVSMLGTGGKRRIYTIISMESAGGWTDMVMLFAMPTAMINGSDSVFDVIEIPSGLEI